MDNVKNSSTLNKSSDELINNFNTYDEPLPNDDLESEGSGDDRNLFRNNTRLTKTTKQSESVYSMQSGNHTESAFHGNLDSNNTDEDDYHYRIHHYQAGQSFDPAADFNNIGPRYIPFEPVVDPSIPSTPNNNDNGNEENKEKSMMTVPALGPDWQADEIKNMSKSHRRQEANWERKHAIKSWFRGQRRCCGINRKTAVFISFGVIIALILLLVFLIPRSPTFTYRSTPLSTDDPDSASFLSYPSANFSFDGSVAISFDTSSSWIPIKISNFEALVYDGQTENQVGKGGYSGTKSFKRSDNIQLDVPVQFSYQANDNTDQTC